MKQELSPDAHKVWAKPMQMIVFVVASQTGDFGPGDLTLDEWCDRRQNTVETSTCVVQS